MVLEEFEKVQPPQGVFPTYRSDKAQVAPPASSKEVFPYPESVLRLNDYDYFERLFLGHHFSAFNIRIDDERFNREHARLRYIVANFAGLVSKVVADMLFGEPITLKAPDGDQEFIEALHKENQLDTQFYESALSNSYNGDAVFKIRIGPRNPNDTESTVIIEDITPKIYFPQIDGFNVRSEPSTQELAWTFAIGENTYLRKEIHTPGLIENKVFAMKGNEVLEEVELGILGNQNLQATENTLIDKSLIVHIPNWKTGNRYFGISDYHDLDTLFYGINNRMTKIDGVLDKHGEPILQVPEGILNEKGEVRKKALGVIEVGEGERGAEYVVWDASLENAFKEIEKLVEFMYLVGEVSPDILGLGQGVSDSGRALKFKLIRTIAKIARKKLYYDVKLKQVYYIAQLMAKAWNVKVGGLSLKKEPVVPEIDWADGLPIDISEQLDNETKAIDAGITSKKDAIQRVYGYDEDVAEQKAKEIKDETAIDMPKMNLGNNPFNNKDNQK